MGKHNMTKQVESVLLHEMWYVDGRVDALRFAWDCGGDIDEIASKIEEVEERIINPPPAVKDRMAQGASTRVYQDGYLAGLNDAMKIVSKIVIEPEKETAVARQS